MASLYKKPVFIRDPRTGEKTKGKSRKWWGPFHDATGRERRIPLAVDHAAAQAMLSERVRRVEREKVGLIEPTDEHRIRPIAQHLKDYRRYLKSKENCPRTRLPISSVRIPKPTSVANAGCWHRTSWNS